MPLPSPQGAPVVVLLGPVGVGKSLLATALAGLPPSNRIFKVGDSAQAVTLEAVCHRCRWFGRASEEELVLVDPPGVGDGEKDTTRLAQVVRLLRDLGSVSLFVVVLNSEQPRIGSVLENLLRLMEECFGRRFWRHVALVFTRYYTDARSARRRGSKTKDMLRDEFSMALATQFPHSQQERTLAADPFPSYFVDSEAAINNELPEAERAAALMELERLSVFARASPCLPTGTDDNTSVGSSTARGREPDTEQECSEDHFATGSWVEIHGLVGTPSLNGMRALVVEFQSQRHRYTVELSNGSRKLIHAKNLQSITETMTDPPEAPHLASGMYCSISGLSGATHLNGQKCLVVSRKDGRYEVQLLDGSLKSIKPVNLTPLPKPPVGERVTVKNAIEGAMVQRGLDWIWNDQDGGDGCVGRIQAIEGDWACVQWNSGRANKYRIGADGSCDLIYVDEFKHENACRKALQRGKSHVEPRHLSRTFAYLHGTRCANVDFFDIRDEVCQAVGGCKHGQRVQVKGMQAVAIGVATLPSPLPHLAQKLEMFFHVERAEGAGIFDEADGIQMRVVGRQRVREAKRPIGTNNQELMEVAKMVKPSFQYMWGPNSYLGMTLERFDVRDEVCVKVGGFKHGQLVKVADKVAVVIGVRLMRGIPKLFFHLDGKPGSGTFDDLSTQQIVLVGTRKVEETADDFLEEPALSPEVEALAGKLECTFSFPLGNPFSKPARFDIRDNVCRAVGGFCHGQVVSDGDGDKAVVVGVKKSDGRPRLFFRAEGNRGAGRFNPYHLYRKELRVVGKQKLQEVSPSDPIFHRPEEGARMEKLLEALLAGAKRSQQRTPHSQPSGLPSDFEFDYSFHYLQKSCDPAFFDIRDEVCMAVGGYRHGDVVQHGFVDRKSVVIGVRPDDEGVPHLWMHRDGAAGASIFREMELLRMTSTVVGRKTVAEFEEPERDFSPEFIAGLQFTFNYPMGLRGRSRPGLFDIRDEVCLAVGGFKHGDRIKWGRTELAVVGVMLEKGLPEMHFQIVKPKSRVGAGMFRNFHLMKQHVKLVGSQTLEEVVLDDSDPTGMSPTRCSSTDSSEPEMDSESSSESESQRAPSRKMSRQASEASEAAHNGGKDGSARALVLRLSHSNSQVKNVLLTSKELDDCRRDVAEDGCEVTPEWANGAILLVPLTQEQARQARLELRSHHVVIFPGDKGRLLNALGALPCRQRPRIRGDEEYDLAASAAREATEDVQAHMAEGLEEGLVLRVDRTFWTFVAPASEFSVNESAPCGDGESRQPRNPRQVA